MSVSDDLYKRLEQAPVVPLVVPADPETANQLIDAIL